MTYKHDNQYYPFAALFLAVGDCFALLLFTFFGTMEHQMEAGFSRIFAITLPFLLAWLAAGLLTGAYRSRAYSAFGSAALAVIRTAVLAVPAAMLLRWLMYSKPFSLAFALVSFAFIVIFLTVWRWAYTWLLKNV